MSAYKTDSQPLTQLPFEGDDFDHAERIARHLGYEQTAYTSTSSLWGLFCMRENPARYPYHRAKMDGCIIKTRELGFMYVVIEEDIRPKPEPEDADAARVSDLTQPGDPAWGGPDDGHAADDPHCTCPDCIIAHERTLTGGDHVCPVCHLPLTAGDRTIGRCPDGHTLPREPWQEGGGRERGDDDGVEYGDPRDPEDRK